MEVTLKYEILTLTNRYIIVKVTVGGHLSPKDNRKHIYKYIRQELK